MNRLFPQAGASRRLALSALALAAATLMAGCADMSGIQTEAQRRTPQSLGLPTEPSAADRPPRLRPLMRSGGQRWATSA